MILKKLVPLAIVAFLALPISAIAHGILPSPGPHASPLDADKSAHTQSVETVTPQAGQENCSIVPLNQCHSHSIYKFLRGWNLCNNNDFQNIAVNGATAGNSWGNIPALSRNQA